MEIDADAGQAVAHVCPSIYDADDGHVATHDVPLVYGVAAEGQFEMQLFEAASYLLPVGQAVTHVLL